MNENQQNQENEENVEDLENLFLEFANKAKENKEPKEPNESEGSSQEENNEEDLTPEQIAEKQLAEETAKKEEEERLAKETADKLAQEEEFKNKNSAEAIKKQALEEFRLEQEKTESARKELLKKEQEERLAKETAEKLAKEAEEDKNWSPESVLTAEEKESLKVLDGEYKEVSGGMKALAKMHKASLEREIAKVRKESEEKLEAQILNYHNYISQFLNPVIETQKLTQEEIAKKEVFNAHPDFVEVTPQVEAWIKSKPEGKLKAGLMQAFTEGDYKDVIELYTDYKKMNGVSNNNAEEKAKLAEKARIDADKKAKEMAEKQLADKKKKEKADALGAVSGSNTEIDSNSSEKNATDWFGYYSNKSKKK